MCDRDKSVSLTLFASRSALEAMSIIICPHNSSLSSTFGAKTVSRSTPDNTPSCGTQMGLRQGEEHDGERRDW